MAGLLVTPKTETRSCQYKLKDDLMMMIDEQTWSNLISKVSTSLERRPIVGPIQSNRLNCAVVTATVLQANLLNGHCNEESRGNNH